MANKEHSGVGVGAWGGLAGAAVRVTHTQRCGSTGAQAGGTHNNPPSTGARTEGSAWRCENPEEKSPPMICGVYSWSLA